MNLLLKKLLFQKSFRRIYFLIFLFTIIKCLRAQVVNYIANPSFENIIDCKNGASVLNNCYSWTNIGKDSTKYVGDVLSIKCFSTAPCVWGIGCQYPKTGQVYYRMANFCTNPCIFPFGRFYPKNRLKATLKANQVYCVKMYVSLEEVSPMGTDGFGFYFSDTSTDTIQYCNMPLTYLQPQVSNPSCNVVLDTVNWVPISGTFTAVGNEKYLIIGNFLSDAATCKSLAIPNSTYTWSEYFVDDVSCIPIDLPAHAGPDKFCIKGDSTFIGREPDVEINESCVW